MSKIPTNNKNNKMNLNISKKNLNSLINFNYLMIKKHLSPKIRLINESKKLNNLSREKEINDKETKINETNKANYSSKICKDIPNQFNKKENENRKIYTRNVINNFKYDSMKDNSNYHSRDNSLQIIDTPGFGDTRGSNYAKIYSKHQKLKDGKILILTKE